MKPKFFLSTLFVLLFLPLCLSAQEINEALKQFSQIKQVKTLSTTEKAEKRLIYFSQPIDHKHPEKGTFEQRVILLHVGYDKPTVIVTEGYGASYALRESYREEISKLFDANMIFVEHRYFLESTPKDRDWKYLTTKNSAADLHEVCKAFKNIYSNKWISTGISKGGQTSMLYRAYYPNDVDISIPYVAPLCMDVEDGRHEPFLKQISTAENRKRVFDFQMSVLKKRESLMPLFTKFCAENKLEFNVPLDEVFDYCVLEYSFAFFQWGTDTGLIPSSEATDAKLFTHFMKISDPSYFAKGGSNVSFFVQAAKELGYYGYDIAPFKKYLKIKSSKDYLHKMMLPDDAKNVKFDKKFSKFVARFLKKNDPKMLFIYGGDDPWTAAGVTWLKNKDNIHVFVQPGGSHRTRISTMSKEMKEKVIGIISEWLN